MLQACRIYFYFYGSYQLVNLKLGYWVQLVYAAAVLVDSNFITLGGWVLLI